MNVLRILLLVMTAGVLAFILYQAITRQIPREAFWTAIAVACGFKSVPVASSMPTVDDRPLQPLQVNGL